jgi:hypothetical protein
MKNATILYALKTNFLAAIKVRLIYMKKKSFQKILWTIVSLMVIFTMVAWTVGAFF